jgi:tetratricopeptide (TPR) repeat protein
MTTMVRVVGRTSAARFKASNRGAEDVARELGAEYVLTGSVRWDHASGAQANDATVRITPALVRASTGERLWGEPVTEKLTDVFKVQADVAERVASALSVSLAATTRTSIRRTDTQDPEAREATMLGWSLVSRRGAPNITQAIVQFRRALARDSMYARAWAGLAEAEAVAPTYGLNVADSIGSIARRAVALDSLSPEAWIALSSTLTFELHLHDALAAADRAIALDPSSAAAHSRRGMVLLALGRVADAEAALRLSTQLDPLVAAYVAREVPLDLARSDTDSLIRRIARVRELEPTNHAFLTFMSGALMQLGHPQEAISACADQAPADACRRQVEAILSPNRRAEALALLDAYSPAYGMSMLGAGTLRAAIYAHLGERDKAFALLRAAFEKPNDRLLFVYVNSPWLAPLKSDPRWQSIVVAGQAR